MKVKVKQKSDIVNAYGYPAGAEMECVAFGFAGIEPRWIFSVALPEVRGFYHADLSEIESIKGDSASFIFLRHSDDRGIFVHKLLANDGLFDRITHDGDQSAFDAFLLKLKKSAF